RSEKRAGITSAFPLERSPSTLPSMAFTPPRQAIANGRRYLPKRASNVYPRFDTRTAPLGPAQSQDRTRDSPGRRHPYISDDRGGGYSSARYTPHATSLEASG